VFEIGEAFQFEFSAEGMMGGRGVSQSVSCALEALLKPSVLVGGFPYAKSQDAV
jgi:hypothetical protein